MNELVRAVDDTIAALEQMKHDGVQHVAVARETLTELGRKPAVTVGSQASPNPAPRLEGRVPPRPVLAQQPAQTDGVPFGSAHDLREPVPPSRTPVVRETSAPPDLRTLAAQAQACVKCRALASCRHTVVFGVGDPHAELMFIGEAPGADEDAQGEPFVGRAGQLLTKIIAAMGFSRSEVYIANVLKCRPPENRPPEPDEVQNCLPFLLAQIELIKPKVMVGLGATAMRALLDVQLGITKMRGHWYTFHGTPIMPTFHPAYLLRNPPAKREVWEDMQEVVRKLGRVLPPASATMATK